MATLLKVLNNLADIKSAGGVALRPRTQGFAVVRDDRRRQISFSERVAGRAGKSLSLREADVRSANEAADEAGMKDIHATIHDGIPPRAGRSPAFSRRGTPSIQY